jgi:hypothetical protein
MALLIDTTKKINPFKIPIKNRKMARNIETKKTKTVLNKEIKLSKIASNTQKKDVSFFLSISALLGGRSMPPRQL